MQAASEPMEDPDLADDSSGCTYCTLDPPPAGILHIPPPPLPPFLKHAADFYEQSISNNAVGSAAVAKSSSSATIGSGNSDSGSGANVGGTGAGQHFDPADPCKHACDWRDQGVRYHEAPHQGNIFEDTWFIVLVCSFVGIIFIGIILATLFIKCKLHTEAIPSNDNASQCSNRSNKNSTLSTSTASSSMHTTTTTTGGGPSCVGLSCKSPIVRLQQEAAILYPCSPQHHLHPHHQQHLQQLQQLHQQQLQQQQIQQLQQQQQQQQQQPDVAGLQDSRVMWATITPRGTTRHYIEEHTYETIGGSESPGPPSYLDSTRHSPQHGSVAYVESPCENTYTEPPVASPGQVPKDDKAFDNTGFIDYDDSHSLKNEYYQLEDVLEPCERIFSVQGVYGLPSRSLGGTLRPRVSSPTRIENPNLPPLNLQRAHRRSNRHHHNHSHNHNHHHSSSSSSHNSQSTLNNQPTSLRKSQQRQYHQHHRRRHRNASVDGRDSRSTDGGGGVGDVDNSDSRSVVSNGSSIIDVGGGDNEHHTTVYVPTM